MPVQAVVIRKRELPEYIANLDMLLRPKVTKAFREESLKLAKEWVSRHGYDVDTYSEDERSFFFTQKKPDAFTFLKAITVKEDKPKCDCYPHHIIIVVGEI